jgi:hypothetical protein
MHKVQYIQSSNPKPHLISYLYMWQYINQMVTFVNNMGYLRNLPLLNTANRLHWQKAQNSVYVENFEADKEPFIHLLDLTLLSCCIILSCFSNKMDNQQFCLTLHTNRVYWKWVQGGCALQSNNLNHSSVNRGKTYEFIYITFCSISLNHQLLRKQWIL